MSRRFAILLLAVSAGSACNSEEVTGGHGTPVDAQFVVGGAAATPGLTLAAGQTVRVEIELLDADGEHIHDLEDGHFASLSFSPSGLATVAAVTASRSCSTSPPRRRPGPAPSRWAMGTTWPRTRIRSGRSP